MQRRGTAFDFLQVSDTCTSDIAITGGGKGWSSLLNTASRVGISPSIHAGERTHPLAPRVRAVAPARALQDIPPL